MDEVGLPDAQRILRRAVQLDRADPVQHGLGAASLEAAAAELGVGSQPLAMALAEARAGAPVDPPGRWERLVGPRSVTVVRPCAVPAPAVTQAAADWLERGHLLRVSTSTSGALVGRRRTDPMASASRAVMNLQGEARLSKVREVRSAVGEVADGTAAVCVHADVSDSRNGAVAVGSSIGTLAMAGVGVGTVLIGPFVVVAAPLAVIGGVWVARLAHRDTLNKVRQSLEETTDAVARGSSPATALQRVGRSLRRFSRA